LDARKARRSGCEIHLAGLYPFQRRQNGNPAKLAALGETRY
jgi:hypothetical protein